MFYRKLWLIVLSATMLIFSFRGVAPAVAAAGFSQVLPYNVGRVYVSPAHGLAFAYNGGLLISTDRGLTWTQLGLRQFNDLAFLAGNAFLISGIPPNNSRTNNTDADLYSSKDNGDDWNPVVPYYEGLVPPAILESAGKDLLGCFGGTLERSADGGQTWTTVPTSGAVLGKGCLAAIDEQTYFTAQGDDASLLVTADGGNSWNSTGIELPKAPVPAYYPESGTWLYGKVTAVKGLAIAFSSAGRSLLYISLDDGKSWKQIDGSKLVFSKGSQPEVVYSAAVAPGGLAFVGTADGVLVSEDYGATWKPAAGNIMGDVTAIACSQAGKKLVVLAAARGVYRMEYNRPAAPPAKKPNLIKFVLGQKSYSVNSKVYAISAAPFVTGQRTFVPVRYLGDAMGVRTAWDQATETVTLTQGKTVVKLVIGSETIIAGGKSSQMEATPLISDGRTYLPAADVAKAFGYTVSWDDKSKTMTIKQGSS
jgi:photosystem II stability/assembly factor-like uncharacterized protein